MESFESSKARVSSQNPHLPKSSDKKVISILKTDDGQPIFFIAETLGIEIWFGLGLQYYCSSFMAKKGYRAVFRGIVRYISSQSKLVEIANFLLNFPILPIERALNC